MGTLLAWVVFLMLLGPVGLALLRVAWAAFVLVLHAGRPDDERPMTLEELAAYEVEGAGRRRALRDMEIEQESWT